MKKLLFIISLALLSNNLFSQCLSGDCKNGYGKFQKSEIIYEGYFYNELANGIGILNSNEGNYYGSFLNNQFNSFGTFYGADNILFVGYWLNGKQHGLGFFLGNMEGAGTWENGVAMASESSNPDPNNPQGCEGNCVNGYGRLKIENMTIQAIFRNGKAVLGQIKHPDFTYYGEIKDNKPHGKGQIQHVNGEFYIGDFKLGLKHGNGILANTKTGEKNQSRWDYGSFEGNGKTSFEDQFTYELFEILTTRDVDILMRLDSSKLNISGNYFKRNFLERYRMLYMFQKQKICEMAIQVFYNNELSSGSDLTKTQVIETLNKMYFLNKVDANTFTFQKSETVVYDDYFCIFFHDSSQESK